MVEHIVTESMPNDKCASALDSVMKASLLIVVRYSEYRRVCHPGLCKFHHVPDMRHANECTARNYMTMLADHLMRSELTAKHSNHECIRWKAGTGLGRIAGNSAYQLVKDWSGQPQSDLAILPPVGQSQATHTSQLLWKKQKFNTPWAVRLEQHGT